MAPIKRPVRTNAGRFDLIPPLALRRLAQLFERDAALYGARDWETGRPLADYVNDAHHHLNLLMAGDNSDDHASRIAWAMLCFMHNHAMIQAGRIAPILDNMPEAEPPQVSYSQLPTGTVKAALPESSELPPGIPPLPEK